MESHADAPGHDATASRLADGPAGAFQPCFTAPSFRAFCALAAGFCARPVALPALARLVHKDIKPAPASRLVLARQMTAALARALPGRAIHVVADAAYAGRELTRLPATVTWTTRLRKDAALYELPGPRTGRRGRPRVAADFRNSPLSITGIPQGTSGAATTWPWPPRIWPPAQQK